MKILSIVGTQRKDSVTNKIMDKLILEFSNQLSDVTIKKYRQNDLDIDLCQGCTYCFYNHVCPIDKHDDMGKIKEELFDSNVILFGIPIYLDHINGFSKVLLDRLGYLSHIFGLAGKQIIYVLAVSQSSIKNVEEYLYRISSHFGCINISFIIYNSSIDYGNIDNKIKKVVENVISFKSKHILTTKLQEKIFSYNKEKYLDMQRKNIDSIELDYWKKTKMLYCESFQEYLERFHIKNIAIELKGGNDK